MAAIRLRQPAREISPNVSFETGYDSDRPWRWRHKKKISSDNCCGRKRRHRAVKPQFNLTIAADHIPLGSIRREAEMAYLGGNPPLKFEFIPGPIFCRAHRGKSPSLNKKFYVLAIFINQMRSHLFYCFPVELPLILFSYFNRCSFAWNGADPGERDFFPSVTRTRGPGEPRAWKARVMQLV